MSQDGNALDWDSVIENDGSDFTLLPEGIATFTVKEFKRGHNSKFKCPQAELKIELNNGTDRTTITDNLPLHTKFEWKSCQFFRAIGQRKHGESFKPNWQAIEGTTGKCKIVITDYEKNGEDKQINNIKEYLDPDSSAEASQEQPAADNVSF